MVEPYSVRYEAPSKQPIISSAQTLSLSTKELEQLQGIHSLLHFTLRNIHEFLVENPESSLSKEERIIAARIRKQLLTGISSDLLPKHIPSFLTTEIVFDAEHHPYVVSVNGHSTRHWDVIAQEAQSGTTALTTVSHLIEAIRSRADDRQPIRILTDPSGSPRLQFLENQLNEAGISVLRYSIKDAAVWTLDPSAPKQTILDLPMLQGTKGNRKAVLANATVILEPFTHLSSQFLFSILTDPTYREFVSNRILHGASTDHLGGYLPRTVSLNEGMQRADPTDLIKRGLPLSSQRTLGSKESFNPTELERHRHTYVAQQKIAPKTAYVPNHGIGPFRCIVVSYGGIVVAAVGIVRLFADDSPERDITMKIAIG